MTRIYNWFRSWFITASVCRQLSGSKQLIDQLDAKHARMMERLNRREQELNALAKRMQTDINDAKRVERQYESSLNEMREQNRVLEVTIQTLVASHKLLIERADADCAVEVRRRVALSPRE